MVWKKNKKEKKITPPLGIEPRTCRLTADRSANGALEAIHMPFQNQIMCKEEKAKEKNKKISPF